MKGWVNHIVNNFYAMNPLIVRQYLETTSSTYTYLLADAVTKEAILIDPVLETVDRFVSFLGVSLSRGLTLCLSFWDIFLLSYLSLLLFSFFFDSFLLVFRWSLLSATLLFSCHCCFY
jgi:hypothetical protein